MTKSPKNMYRHGQPNNQIYQTPALSVTAALKQIINQSIYSFQIIKSKPKRQLTTAHWPVLVIEAAWRPLKITKSHPNTSHHKTSFLHISRIGDKVYKKFPIQPNLLTVLSTRIHGVLTISTFHICHQWDYWNQYGFASLFRLLTV